MFKVKKCKSLARKTLLGKYACVVIAQILAFIFPFILGLLCVGSLALAAYGGNLFGTGRDEALLIVGALLFSAFLILTVLSSLFMRYGVTKLFIHICRGEKYGVGDIWYPFTRGAHPFKILVVEILNVLFLGACSILVMTGVLIYGSFGINGPTYVSVLCGILIFLFILLLLFLMSSLFLSDLVIIDNPEAGISGAISGSFKLMKGHRLKGLWFIFFSFIFWQILVSFCHLTALWIIPYAGCSRIFFYLMAGGKVFDEEEKKETEVVYGDKVDDADKAREGHGAIYNEGVSSATKKINAAYGDNIENADKARGDSGTTHGKSVEDADTAIEDHPENTRTSFSLEKETKTNKENITKKEEPKMPWTDVLNGIYTEHKNIENKDTELKDTEFKDTEHKDTEHIDTENKDIEHIDTELKDIDENAQI